MWVVIGLAVLIFVLTFVVLLKGDPKKDNHMNPWQIHHGYIGSAMMVVAALLPWTGWWLLPVVLLGAFGLWFALDDLYQHNRQRREPFYRSPIHIWAADQGIIK